MSQAWITAIYGDISKIQNVPGSNNQKLLKEIILNFKEDIAGENEWIAEWNNDEPETIQKALTQLISGDLNGGQYGYIAAFQYVCKQVGKQAEDEVEFYSFEFKDLLPILKKKKLNLLNKKWNDLISNKGLGINFPKNDKARWPVTTFVKKEDVSKILKEMEGGDLNSENEDYEMILESIKIYFKEALEKKTDVLFFLSEG